MEDFNDMTEKVDAAIAGRLGPLKLIDQTALSSYSGFLQQDLSGIDWTEWDMVFLFFNPVPGIHDYSLQVRLEGNNLYDQLVSSLTAETSILVGPKLFLLFPLRSTQGPIRYLSFPGGAVSQINGSYTALTALTANSNENQTLASGSKIQVYGL